MTRYEDSPLVPRDHARRSLLKRYRALRPFTDQVMVRFRAFATVRNPAGSETNAAEILALSYPILVHSADYPSVEHGSAIENRVRALAEKAGLDLSVFTDRERFHTAMVVCYYLYLDYISRGSRVSPFRYLTSRIPLYYVRQLKKEACGRVFVARTDRTGMSESEAEPEVPVPGSVQEFIEHHVKQSPAHYARGFLSSSRSTMWRRLTRRS